MRVLSLAYYGPQYSITFFFINIWDKFVILGSYIPENKIWVDQSIIKALQAPPWFKEESKSRNHSGGRFIILQKGFLYPKIYNKDRKIIVESHKAIETQKLIDATALYPSFYLRNLCKVS